MTEKLPPLNGLANHFFFEDELDMVDPKVGRKVDEILNDFFAMSHEEKDKRTPSRCNRRNEGSRKKPGNHENKPRSERPRSRKRILAAECEEDTSRFHIAETRADVSRTLDQIQREGYGF